MDHKIWLTNCRPASTADSLHLLDFCVCSWLQDFFAFVTEKTGIKKTHSLVKISKIQDPLHCEVSWIPVSFLC
jgi:hypothetical protein